VRMAREIDPDVYSSRWVTGIVAEFDDLGIVQPQTATTSDRLIRIVIIPSLARLAVRRDCRVFQDLSALEIVREVFRAAGVYGFLPDIPGVAEATNFVSDLVEKIPVVGGAVSDALSGQYIRMMPPSGVTEDAWTHPREFCVQYRESDLDFVRRLLEEEGINFCFEMLRGIERIVFVHDPGTSEEVDTIDGRAIPFYWPDRTDRPIVEAVTEIGEMRKLRTNKVVLRDFNFADAALAPTELLSSEATAEAEGVAIERYEYPARAVYQYEEEADPKIYYRNYDATKDRDLAKLRLEEEITNARSVRVRCDVITSQAGRVLEVLGHFFRDQSTYGSRADRLLVRQLSLRGAGQGVPNLLYGGPNAPWMNPNAVDCSIEVVAQWLDPAKPERTPVRPRRQIPVPRITSLQTATVVDDDGSHSEDELLFTDDPKLSRIRVRFHWDRRGEVPLGIDLPLVDLGKSAWVRVAHGWAGADFGMLFTPRIGSEVLVAFEEGDPNRPLVIGMLYDGEHPVPVKDAAESTIHTRTTPWDEDDGVQSELTFFDKTDKEEIRFKAGRYLVEEVRRIHAMTVGRKQHAIVDRHHGEIVEGKQETVVVKKRTKTVRTDELVEIKGGHTHMIEGDHERMITASRKETVKGIEKLEIEENRSLTVNGDRVTEIGKKGAEPANDVHDVKGMRTDTVTGTLIVTAASTAIGQPGGEGASKPRAQVAAGETEDGAEVAIESEKGAKFVAGKEVTVTSDNDMIHVDATESIDVECEGEKLHIATVDGIALTSTARVQVHTDHGVLLITPEEVRLRAMGGEDAVTVVSADAVLVSGKTFVATATLEYEVQSSGPATHGG
jgi:type VI secretion system secreted protein VgrG